ncbi:MAG: hypothetical protein JRH07_08875 [Deltaproteobacteria bacterium]|nr:hypothetical protein [Deltaproteobacteria bacterium]MBW2121945.1 hypothetical protein [Deltaproteobacteria bacterium]
MDRDNRFGETVDRRVRTIGQSAFVIHLAGKVRRFYLVHFKKGYVQRQLALRRGKCHQCGRCCSFLFVCPMLTRQGLCSSYDRFRPMVCKVFPIDQRDIDEVTLSGGQCGYRFEAPYSRNPPPRPLQHISETSQHPARSSS